MPEKNRYNLLTATFTIVATIVLIASCSDQGDKPTEPDNSTPLISISDMTVAEVNTLIFSINLSSTSNDIISFNYTTSDQTATAGSDYTAISGTDSILAGEQSTTILVSTLDDNIVESTETFLLTLSSAVNAQLFDSVALGSITDDETVRFATDIQPILRVECAKLGICHGATPGGGQLYIGPTASYTLVRNASSQNGPIIVANNSAQSHLYTVLTSNPIPPTRMPKSPNDTLTTVQQKLFKDWIDQGALDN